MIDLAHRASHPVCWYSIDPLDKDPKRFLAHFINAIKINFPSFGNQSLSLLENLPDPLGSSDQFVSTLMRDLYNSITENFAIFLDDFHLIDEQQEITNFLGCFGKLMDENSHLVISSRNIFNFLDLPLLIGRNQVLAVDQNDLAFHPDELQNYFQEKLKLRLTIDQAKEIIERTSGWITGVLLRASNYPSPLPNQNKASRVTGIDLDDYFVDQVLCGQSPSARKLMFLTSIFEEFNADLCTNMFGESRSPSWHEFQHSLTESNLFVDQIEDSGVWLRYHDLFRKFLYKQFEKHYSSEKDQILSKLINSYLSTKDWEHAYITAQRLGNPRILADVIYKSFGPLFHAGRIKLLASWFKGNPNAVYDARPILYSLKGFTSNELGNPSLGLVELNHSLEIKAIKKDPILKAKSLIWRATSHRFLGKYKRGIKDCNKALKIISSKQNLHEIKAEAFREIGLGYGRLGDNNYALKYLEKAEDQYILSGWKNNVAQVRVDIGHVYLNLSKFEEAERYFKETIPHWTNQGNNIQLSNLMNNLGYLSLLLGRYHDAEKWLARGEEIAYLASSKRMQSFITASRGDLARSLGLFSNSINYYKKSLTSNDDSQDSFLSVYIPIYIAHSYRCNNEPQRGEEKLTNISRKVHNNSSLYELGLWNLEFGFIKLALKSYKEAIVHFKESLKVFESLDRPYDIAKSLLGLIISSKYQYKMRVVRKYLKTFDLVLSELFTLHPILQEINQHLPSLSNLIVFAPDCSALHKCHEELIQFRKNLPVLQSDIFPPEIISQNNAPLEIQGLGDTIVQKDGKRIAVSEWVHQKTVREILYFLLSNPDGATKEEIGLTFWPNSSPDQLSCQFKNAVYRLRRAIGQEYIIYKQIDHKYSFNWASNFKYDVLEFQNTYQLAICCLNETEKIEHIRLATKLYKHPFGPKIDGIWAESIRQRIYLNYEELMLSLADYDLTFGNYSLSKDTCLTILDIEPCQEEAYKIGIQAMRKLNDITGIQRLYNRCQQSFQEILGIPPSKALTVLYQESIQRL